MEEKKIKVAITGARGISNYGGFESFVSEISFRLAKRGYEVYCSSEIDKTSSKKINEVNLIYFPIKIPKDYGIIRKILHVFYKIYFAVYFSIYKQCDVIYFLGSAQNIFTIIPRIVGKTSIVNMGGLEWERSKFSKLEKLLLKINFKSALICSNRMVIDNKQLSNHINSKYHEKLIYIPYGVEINLKNIKWNEEIVTKYIKDEFKLHKDDFWLIVTRLSPDNNVHTVLEAFIKSKSKKPLVIIGGLSSSDSYCSKISKILAKNRDKKIIFTGGIYNQDHLNMFRNNAFGYIHAHSIGGTNPSLLEAMFLKNIIIAHDNEFNREVANDSALYFKDSDDLKNKMDCVENRTNDYLELKKECYEIVTSKYSWEIVVKEYDNLLDNEV